MTVKGKFWRDSSGHLNFSTTDVAANDYAAVRGDIVNAFGLETASRLTTNGCDIMFQDFKKNESVIGIEWDNWMGFILVAQNAEAEDLVRAIAQRLMTVARPGGAW